VRELISGRHASAVLGVQGTAAIGQKRTLTLVKGRALARPSERSERFEPLVRIFHHFREERLMLVWYSAP
jgi:hypothetical protein